MPMWCPPTPPSSDGDVYCDSWARALYRRGAAPDALLPPVRWRDPRAARSPRRLRPARAAPAPPSLFERAGSRPRPRARPAPPPLRDHAAPPPDWSPCEDAALRRALRLQRLPAEPPAAHRRGCLRRLAAENERRCWRLPLFGADLRAALTVPPDAHSLVPRKSIEDFLAEMHDVIDRIIKVLSEIIKVSVVHGKD
ncbi:E1A-binding protein p400-like [Zerene cesonia]|uniref:E1A-binding protein p400-like n=1 Tax=Zerene cesonia TaxID=33412 RepID=UPI0018E58A06|nr:E1A-binding protein p400-like [Zerene cesonia]